MRVLVGLKSDLGRLANGRFPFHSRRIAPKIFQTVKGAFVSVKDMNHDLEIIEHDPLTGREPVNGHRPNLLVLL